MKYRRNAKTGKYARSTYNRKLAAKALTRLQARYRGIKVRNQKTGLTQKYMDLIQEEQDRVAQLPYSQRMKHWENQYYSTSARAARREASWKSYKNYTTKRDENNAKWETALADAQERARIYKANQAKWAKALKEAQERATNYKRAQQGLPPIVPRRLKRPTPFSNPTGNR